MKDIVQIFGNIYLYLINKYKNYKINQTKSKLKSTGLNVFIHNSARILYPENISINGDCYIGPGAFIDGIGDIDIANNVIIGPNITVLTSNHNYESDISLPYDGKTILKKVTIGKNVWIGANAIILPGANIGEGCVVGAGSVVNGKIEPFSVIAGNPARIIKQRNKVIYKKLDENHMYYLKLKKECKIEFTKIRKN